MSTPNPFTRFLRSRSRKPRAEARAIEAFIEVCDRLETLVISVYRAGQATAEDERELAAIRAWMRDRYPRHEAELAQHWPGLRAAGEPVDRDPLRSLWETPSAAQLVDNWAAMQRLPAAREMLNRWLLAQAPG